MELRECPCGNTDVGFRLDEGDCRPPVDPWSVFCSNMECAWEFGWFRTKEEAAAEWNTRASDTAIKALVEAMGESKHIFTMEITADLKINITFRKPYLLKPGQVFDCFERKEG